jgi:hypothetical protein
MKQKEKMTWEGQVLAKNQLKKAIPLLQPNCIWTSIANSYQVPDFVKYFEPDKFVAFCYIFF